MKRKYGDGSIYKRNGSPTWWIKFYRHGRPFRESTGTTNEGKAMDKLKTRLAQVRVGSFNGLRIERLKVDELAKDFLRDYKINSRKSADDVDARWRLHLRPFFSGMRAVDVTTEELARYVDKRQEQDAAAATINRELAALRRMFRLGAQATPPKLIRVPKFPMLKENNTRTGFLTDAQRASLAAECASVGLWLRAIFEVGCTYGWRISEIVGLRVRHVDIAALTIRLDPGSTKNGRGRCVTFGAQSALAQLLAACAHGKSAEDYLFTRGDGKPVRVFRTTWKNVCVHAGVPGLLFHDLRRTAARDLRRAGVTESVTMAIGGWRTRSMFDRYAIVTENDLADAVLKLETDRKQRDAAAAEQRERENERAQNRHNDHVAVPQPASRALN